MSCFQPAVHEFRAVRAGLAQADLPLLFHRQLGSVRENAPIGPVIVDPGVVSGDRAKLGRLLCASRSMGSQDRCHQPGRKAR